MKNISCILLFCISSVISFSTQNLSKEKKYSKFISEAEIKHGRVAMLSSLIIPTLEIFNGNNPGINELSHQNLSFQLSCFGLFGISEVCQLYKAYKFPMEPNKWFELKESHIPGDYNFDLLNLTDKIAFSKVSAKDIELSNGRLAMLAAFGMLVQELCTDKTVLETFVNGP